MRTDGQTDIWTDITKLIVAFRNSSGAPKLRGEVREQMGITQRAWFSFWQVAFIVNCCV